MANKILRTTLPNGLELIGEPMGKASSAAIGFFVKTGSRDETAKEAGVSHFLEHMMFKGTPKRTSLDLTFHMGNIGAQANAFTSEENTVYYSAILPEYFSEMQEILGDMLRPSLVQEEFDTEKKVILEEIALYQDRPHFYLFENSFKDYFGSHPAGNSVLGTTQTVGAISRDEMKNYFDRRYSPNNIALVAAGNFNWEKFIEEAQKQCGGWKPHAAPRKVERYPAQHITKEYRKKNLNQAHVLLVTEGPGVHDDERYALTLLSIILGDSSGSKLYWELVDSGLADSAGADSDERDGTGIFMAYASTEPGNIDKVAQLLSKVMSDPLNFTEAELQQAKTKCMSRLVLGGELPMGRLMSLGLEWNSRRTVEPMRALIDRIQAITVKDIEVALKRYPLKQWSQFRLIPE